MGNVKGLSRTLLCFYKTGRLTVFSCLLALACFLGGVLEIDENTIHVYCCRQFSCCSLGIELFLSFFVCYFYLCFSYTNIVSPDMTDPTGRMKESNRKWAPCGPFCYETR